MHEDFTMNPMNISNLRKEGKEMRCGRKIESWRINVSCHHEMNTQSIHSDSPQME